MLWAFAMNASEAVPAGILLMLLGLGLAGLGLLGRKKIPIGGRYLALGMKEVNLRGASLFQRPEGKEPNIYEDVLKGKWKATWGKLTDDDLKSSLLP